jgi:hypothetical protein
MKIKRIRKAASTAERSAERALKTAIASIRSGTKALQQAEKAGKLNTWKNRIGLAMQLVQVGMMAVAAAKGLRVGKAARPARASAKHAARKTKTRSR